MEGVWKRDIRLACKALDPKAEDGDQNLDVQLGKMDVGLEGRAKMHQHNVGRGIRGGHDSGCGK
jgi:hypothetical protein